jgi:hypothetical protein
MPVNYKRDYPPNWRAFSRSIIFDRAKERCECTGECGRAHGTLKKPGRCSKVHRAQILSEARIRRPRQERKLFMVILTCAHLWQGACQCAFKCAEPSHVKALCQACHLAYDLEERVSHARATREKKKDSRRPVITLAEKENGFDVG